MAKPIVIIYLDDESIGEQPVSRMCVKIMEQQNELRPDYYWFCVPDHEAKRVELKVFHEKDFTEVQYQELKTIIEQAVIKIKHHE